MQTMLNNQRAQIAKSYAAFPLKTVRVNKESLHFVDQSQDSTVAEERRAFLIWQNVSECAACQDHDVFFAFVATPGVEVAFVAIPTI